MSRVYETARGVQVSYDDLMAKKKKFQPVAAKSELVAKAKEVAKERQINGFIPAAPDKAPEDVTTVVLASPEVPQTKKPKVSEGDQ